jgi:hypothetical protein
MPEDDIGAAHDGAQAVFAAFRSWAWICPRVDPRDAAAGDVAIATGLEARRRL